MRKPNLCKDCGMPTFAGDLVLRCRYCESLVNPKSVPLPSNRWVYELHISQSAMDGEFHRVTVLVPGDPWHGASVQHRDKDLAVALALEAYAAEIKKAVYERRNGEYANDPLNPHTRQT